MTEQERYEQQSMLLNTTDGHVWAREFMKNFGDKKQDIDEGLMIAWMCNAIGVGREAGRKAALKAEAER